MFTHSQSKNLGLKVAGAMAVLGLMAQTLAAVPVQIHADDTGVGLSGHDPVAYFTVGEPIRGAAAMTSTHDGVTYRFSSAENRDTFVSDPGRYLPQYGGFCAYGTTLGKKFETDPTAWKIVDGKLYLNKNPSVRKTWIKDVPGNIAKADRQWPEIKNIPAKEL